MSTHTRTPGEAAADAVDLLADLDIAEVPAHELPAVAALLGRISSISGGMLVPVAERLHEPAALDALGHAGWASPKDFLTQVTGGRKGAGGGLVRVADETTQLPAVRQALGRGMISLAQARAITTRLATLPRAVEFRAQVADQLLERAVTGGYDATDLDRAFPAAVEEADPDRRLRGREEHKPVKEQAAHRARFLSFADDAVGGGVHISGYATLEEAETVKATLMPLAAPSPTEAGACGGATRPITGRSRNRDAEGLHIGSACPDPECRHDGRDPRDHGARMWDALLESCRRLQHDDDLPHAHGTTARLMVTIDYADLLDQLADPGDGVLPGSGSLTAASVRRLACDAEIIPAVLGADSQILDVGRAQRLVTTPIWNALVLRDQHCAFPGCNRLPLACDAHHIIHWADGGDTAIDNLILLCRRHHTITHHTPWTVSIDPGTRQPVWKPPAPIDDRHRYTYAPATRPPLIDPGAVRRLTLAR